MQCSSTIYRQNLAAKYDTQYSFFAFFFSWTPLRTESVRQIHPFIDFLSHLKLQTVPILANGYFFPFNTRIFSKKNYTLLDWSNAFGNRNDSIDVKIVIWHENQALVSNFLFWFWHCNGSNLAYPNNCLHWLLNELHWDFSIK